MELLILSDQFIIQYKPLWIIILLLAGLFFFFLSKFWRKKNRDNYHFGFKPSILFVVSFIFLMGGINFFVYKVVLNKDRIILFNVQDYNKHLAWKDILKVEYEDENQLMIYMQGIQSDSPLLINLQGLDQDSMDKVKILIAYKLRQSRKLLAQKNNKALVNKNNKPLAGGVDKAMGKNNENTR